MYPGYRKNTKFIVDSRSNQSITTKNEVVELINKYSSADEFYEIEPAEVIKVWMNPEEDGFPTTTEENDDGEIEIVSDLAAVGSVIVCLRESQARGEELETLVYPISPHIVQYPLIGEVVNVASYEGKLFYSNPLNLNGSINTNRLPGRLGDGYVTITNTKLNRKIYPEPGDLIIQGRFGQSIRMGSDDNYAKPNLKISVGQGYDEDLNSAKAFNKYYPHFESINNDEACIWMTTNEHIPLFTPKNISIDKSEDSRGGDDNSLIVVNSDCIVFNSRKSRIHMFSNENINLSAVNEINLETPAGEINLLDPNSTNPIVRGVELKTFLEELVQEYNKNLKAIVSLVEPMFRSDFGKQQISELRDNINSSKSTLMNKLSEPEFFSDRVFIGINRNESSVDLTTAWNSKEWTE